MNFSIKPYISATFSLIIFISFAPSLVFSWELELDENGIKVYTQDIEGSNFKAFRGTTEVKSSLINVLAHHLDLESMTEWLQDCSESTLVKRIDSHDFYLYQRTEAPWPVSDRDYVVHMNISQNSDDFSILISFEASVEESKTDEDCVPITQLKGYWRFTPQSADSVFVEYETSADPAGDLPSWLANSFVVDQPLGSLTKLRERVENNSYTLPEEMNYIIEPTFESDKIL